MTQNTKVWLYGLVAAGIGAAGSSVATILVAPDRFNLTSLLGFLHLLTISMVAGLINIGAYLSKSPLPSLQVTEDTQSQMQGSDGTVMTASSTKTTSVSQ